MSNYPLRDKLIAVSMSENEELLTLGYSAEHLNDLCLQLARSLLRLGASVAYGGILGVGNFTKTLYEAARWELESHPSKNENSILKTPFVNYQPWPHYLRVTLEEVARQQDTCRYEFVGDREVPGQPSGDKNDDNRRAAHASTRMRRWMAADCHSRIVVGGKTTKFAGLLPGIVEEALFHLEAKKPLYIVGGFGGAAGDLAKAILRRSDADPLPGSLNQESREGSVPFDDLLQAFPNANEAVKLQHDVSYEDARRSYARLHDQVNLIRKSGLRSLNNGLDAEANASLMKSEDANEIVGSVVKGLNSVL